MLDPCGATGSWPEGEIVMAHQRGGGPLRLKVKAGSPVRVTVALNVTVI